MDPVAGEVRNDTEKNAPILRAHGSATHLVPRRRCRWRPPLRAGLSGVFSEPLRKAASDTVLVYSHRFWIKIFRRRQK